MNRAAKMTFVGSIILNVLLLGFVVGQSPRRFDRNAVRQQRIEQVIKDLPEASQQRLRDRFQQLRASAEPLFDQMRRAQDDAVQLLGAEPFDQEAFERQEGKINDLRAQMSKQFSQFIKTAIKDLSPEERQRFAQMLRRPPSNQG
ncbi:MAG TPA: periplasmic heavy metal sensor [Terriglobales bacterium]|jgi:uncharacterized membrane protein|nr:periplasmic heavy metal sensor [Terriglobales bacterium]